MPDEPTTTATGTRSCCLFCLNYQLSKLAFQLVRQLVSQTKPITHFLRCLLPAFWTNSSSMGMCLPCLGGAADDVVVTPDPDTRRRQLAEAAEKRAKETTYRGVKNPEAVERKKKKQEETEKQAMTTSVSGGRGGGLKWQVG